jgi:phage baseplate assembly protein W
MKAISYPFQLGSGRIQSTTDQHKIYFDRIVTLLSTMNGQRPMRPTYGTDIARGVYETGGDYVDGVRQAIKSAMALWIPEVDIDNLSVTLPDENGHGRVDLSVTLPDFTQGTVSVNTSYILPDGTTYGQ